MLKELFPKAHKRFLSLPLLGSIAESFTNWLQNQGYRPGSSRHYIRALSRLDTMIRLRGRSALSEVTREDLRACRPANSQDDRNLAGTVHALERYLETRSLLPPLLPIPLSRNDTLVADYKHFLEDVRGLSRSTVTGHLCTVSCFLEHVGYESTPSQLVELKPCEVETFITRLGKQHCRASLQHDVRVIQAADQLEPLPLSPIRAQVYRLAIVLLYTTGLRRGELLHLRIDDYDPQQQCLLVRRSKFHKSRHLPLSVDTGREIT